MFATKPTRFAARCLVVALLVTAAGCTVSEWDTSESDAADSTTVVEYTKDEAGLEASLTAALSNPADNFNEWSPSVDEADCASKRLVSRFGVARLLEAGYNPQVGSLVIAWTPEEQTAAVNILVGCIPFEEGLLELIVGYDKVSLDVASCISRGADRRRVPTLLARSLVAVDGGEPPSVDAPNPEGDLARELAELTVDCLGPEDLQPNAPIVPLPDDQRNDIEPVLGVESTTTTP